MPLYLNNLLVVQSAAYGVLDWRSKTNKNVSGEHGGIWNWRPSEAFHQGIKRTIMGVHSAPDGDPLLYIQPGFKVPAAFYVSGGEVLESAWDHPTARRWLNQTYSGKLHTAELAASEMSELGRRTEAEFGEKTSEIADFLNNLGR